MLKFRFDKYLAQIAPSARSMNGKPAMGFDVFGPTRRVQASNIDDGSQPLFDVFTMPAAFGLNCPQLDKLRHRFYDSTILRFAGGDVHGLRDELSRLLDAYRARREPELIEQRHIRARDERVRAGIVARMLREDTIYRVLEDFRLLCEEAIAAKADVRCEGD